MSPLKNHLGGFDNSDSSIGNCLNKQELHDHGTSFCFTTTNNKHAFFLQKGRCHACDDVVVIEPFLRQQTLFSALTYILGW